MAPSPEGNVRSLQCSLDCLLSECLHRPAKTYRYEIATCVQAGLRSRFVNFGCSSTLHKLGWKQAVLRKPCPSSYAQPDDCQAMISAVQAAADVEAANSIADDDEPPDVSDILLKLDAQPGLQTQLKSQPAAASKLTTEPQLATMLEVLKSADPKLVEAIVAFRQHESIDTEQCVSSAMPPTSPPVHTLLMSEVIICIEQGQWSLCRCSWLCFIMYAMALQASLAPAVDTRQVHTALIVRVC